MKLRDITQYLESIAPLQYQESYDNAGLLTGLEEQELSGVMISLDATEAVIDEAIEKNCNLVISHHPIVFRGLKKINGKTYIERVIIKAIKNDIALYAIHTNLDNVYTHGVSTEICNRLGLLNTRVLVPKSDIDKNGMVGLGSIGELDTEMSAIECLAFIKDRMEATVIRHTDTIDKQIKTIAVCGGSGSSLLSAAIFQGADLYISADFKYHEFFDANKQIIIADIGHFESEQFTIKLLHKILSKKFSNFALFCTSVNTNPVNYF